jgi:hypothetical protein
MVRSLLLFLFTALLISSKSAAQLRLSPLSDTVEKKTSLKVLPHNFYIQHVGFICKKEFQLQKKLSLPLYIRLGSKETVDRMEGKNNVINR